MHNASLQEMSPGDLVQSALYQALDMMNARQVREFAVPPSTLMGPGAVSRCGQSLVDRGIERVFLMVDGGLHQAGMTQVLLRSLEQSGVAYEIWACPPGEPIDTDVNAAVTQLLQVQCDGVIALGGGSVLDAAKATALQAANPTLNFAELTPSLRLKRRRKGMHTLGNRAAVKGKADIRKQQLLYLFLSIRVKGLLQGRQIRFGSCLDFGKQRKKSLF